MRGGLLSRLVTLGALVAGVPAAYGQGEPVPPGDVRITLERHGCAGSCPQYRVSLTGAGVVSFDGRSFVLADGHRERQIDPADVHALILDAERHGLFAQGAAASADAVIDGPHATITISDGRRTARLVEAPSSPAVVTAFADRIDAVARTRPWLRLDTDTLQVMVREHQRPSQRELDAYLHTAVEYDDVAVVRALLDLGADANSPSAESASPPLLSARSVETTALLLDAGANPLAANDMGLTPLWRAAASPAETVTLLLRRGIPVDHPADAAGRTLLWLAACQGNREVVQLVIAAGANPSARFEGQSALDCARRAAGSEQAAAAAAGDGGVSGNAAAGSDQRRPYGQDFAGTIRVLEQALTRTAPVSRAGDRG